MNKVFIIAEAGINHNGSVKIAKKMVEAAKDAGADAVKFQTFQVDRLITRAAKKTDYQIQTTGSNETQFEMLKRFQLSPDDFEELYQYCHERKIIFMSTPFDEESVDMLDALGMKIFKIPSGEITNKPLIQHVAKKGKPIVLSTGMSYLEEVDRAITWMMEVQSNVNSEGQSFGYPLSSSPVLLHCVSSYPAAFEELNLMAMKTMKDTFLLPVGFSDHTLGVEASIAAVALGASIIEKHFTLDRRMEGPDHRASLEVSEMKEMIRAIRNIEVALGNGIKKPAASEKDNRTLVRKSIVAAKNIKAGEKIGFHELAIKRPGTGIPPEYLETVIGMIAIRPIAADSIITWEDLKNA